MAVKSDCMRLHLFADNYWLRAHSETLQDKAPKQKVIEADIPGPSAQTKKDRPRDDFNMPLSFWCNLGGVFFKGPGCRLSMQHVSWDWGCRRRDRPSLGTTIAPASGAPFVLTVLTTHHLWCYLMLVSKLSAPK